MVREVKIPIGRGVDIPWVGGSIYHGYGGQIPWIGGLKIPWVGGSIYLV